MAKHETPTPFSDIIVIDDDVLGGHGGDSRLWGQIRAAESALELPVTEIYPQNVGIKGNTNPEDVLAHSTNRNSLVIAYGPEAIGIAVHGIRRANQGGTLLALKEASFVSRHHGHDLSIPRPRGYGGILRLLQHLDYSKVDSDEAHYIAKQERAVALKALAEVCLPPKLEDTFIAAPEERNLPISA